MSKAQQTFGTGRSFAQLANDVSDAMTAALMRGMEADEACCCAVAVIADYARGTYGAAYLPKLAEVLIERANHELPEHDDMPFTGIKFVDPK